MSTTSKLVREREAIRALFAATDQGDLARVTSYLQDDVVVVLGNREPIHGAEAYAELYGQVAGMLAGLRHEILDIWSAAEDASVWIVQMTVHYTRADGYTVSLPCCNVLRFTEGLVSDYRVFMDMTPVFA
jgi:ketosteroid isomerase-like protein